MKYLLASLAAYFLGSMPSGYLSGRLTGIDVREHGSGNIGATNVLRILGKRFGYAVFFADTLKGFLAVRLAFWIGSGSAELAYRLGILAAICAVVGHSFPVWLAFRGGKGVATSAGACLGLLPAETLVAGAVWIIMFLLFRFVSLASVTAAAALPLSLWLFAAGEARFRRPLLAFTVALAALVIVRHCSNIKRLFQGREPRFDRK
jgi:acyl phosphate:glycerol-3-phosphate acyltransferase